MSKILRCGLSSLLLITASSLEAAPPQWTMSEIKGEVWVVGSDGNKAAARGQAVPSGMTIATGKAGRAVLVRGEEYLIVSPNSRFRVTGSENQSTVSQIFEEAGNLLFKIKKMATPHFGVETPYLAAVVKGTTFSVTVTPTGAAVQVLEGAVQVETLDGGASQLVTPGIIGMVGADARYTLKMQGGGDKVITSPNAPPSAAPAPSPSSESSSGQDMGAAGPVADAISPPLTTGIDVPGVAPTAMSSATEGQITSAVTSNNGNVSAATGGLVTGEITAIAAAATASGTAADKAVMAEVASGDRGNGTLHGNIGIGSAGGNGNGNADNGGNDNSGSNGNIGNGNFGNSGNGNAGDGNAGQGNQGNGNGNGGSNGNNGNGNSNSGSGNNNASSSGNGKGNSGFGNGSWIWDWIWNWNDRFGNSGNGNSNLGSGNNGNANGIGNGNSGGNGNGNGNAGQGNQGNGNGNGGSGGSGGGR